MNDDDNLIFDGGDKNNIDVNPHYSKGSKEINQISLEEELDINTALDKTTNENRKTKENSKSLNSVTLI